ncbi:unnamed protein product [Oppiella nova]|uniref:Uncharacterized protein n=1 Tax=Oppiella nova TaxID=334625 RepID=A0A7R9LX06_9ACAR|nr:unnamed protein product [Oppiella nova]CAG2167763.1 unnamed protein product [Oppiella nova]
MAIQHIEMSMRPGGIPRTHIAALAVSVIGVLVVPTIGLLATYKQHFGLATTFALLLTVTTITGAIGLHNQFVMPFGSTPAL